MLRLMSGKIWNNGCEVQLTDFEDEGGTVTGEIDYGAWIRRLTNTLDEKMRETTEGIWEQEAVLRKFRWAGHAIRRPEGRIVVEAMGWQRNAPLLRRGSPGKPWVNTLVHSFGSHWEVQAHDRIFWSEMSKIHAEQIVATL